MDGESERHTRSSMPGDGDEIQVPSPNLQLPTPTMLGTTPTMLGTMVGVGETHPLVHAGGWGRDPGSQS